MVVRLADLALPLALWNALDGDPAAFVAKLRSDEPLSRPERDCLALWLENGRKAPKRARGRPEEAWLGGVRWDPVGMAANHYRFLWKFFKRKGWHRKGAGKFYCPPDRLKRAVADRHKIDVRVLDNLLRRGTKLTVKRHSFVEHWIEHLENRRSK